MMSTRKEQYRLSIKLYSDTGERKLIESPKIIQFQEKFVKTGQGY